MEQTTENLGDCVTELLEQANQNVDRYISISEEGSEFITGMTVFIDQ